MTSPVSQFISAHTADALSVGKRPSLNGVPGKMAPLHGGTHRLPEAAAAPATRHGGDAGLRLTGMRDPSLAPAALPQRLEAGTVEDWDLMFAAVAARLRHAVGEQLGQPPEMPGHSAVLSASLVQAVVLDCVKALEQLHSALQQERSQRPTP